MINISQGQDNCAMFLKCNLQIRVVCLILKLIQKYFYYILLNKITVVSLMFCHILGVMSQTNHSFRFNTDVMSHFSFDICTDEE